MGYTTEFQGKFEFNKVLDDATYNMLYGLANTRRMARKIDKKYGVEGEFYFNDLENLGQDHETGVIDYNKPPKTQPSLWCQWTPTKDKKYLQWDQNEKFYEYIKWLQYIIDKILKPKKYKLNGMVSWRGEHFDDTGTITVKNNKITIS
jgi:hypothetical protein